MVHVRGQSVQRQDVPHLMEEHGAAGMVRLPAPWHTEQLLGQPGQAQALPHGSVSQHGGALWYAPASQQADRDVVLAAVTDHGVTLQHAADVAALVDSRWDGIGTAYLVSSLIGVCLSS